MYCTVKVSGSGPGVSWIRPIFFRSPGTSSSSLGPIRCWLFPRPHVTRTASTPLSPRAGTAHTAAAAFAPNVSTMVNARGVICSQLTVAKHLYCVRECQCEWVRHLRSPRELDTTISICTERWPVDAALLHVWYLLFTSHSFRPKISTTFIISFFSKYICIKIVRFYILVSFCF